MSVCIKCDGTDSIFFYFSLNVCSLLPEGEQLWFLPCRPSKGNPSMIDQKVRLMQLRNFFVKMCAPSPSKMCHWMSTQLVPLWIFRFQTWGLLFKLRWRIWNKMFFVWLPWPALWLLKLLGVEFETWWLLQPSESLNGSPLRHHCCLKGVLRGLEVYRSRLCHLPLPLSLSFNPLSKAPFSLNWQGCSHWERCIFEAVSPLKLEWLDPLHAKCGPSLPP